MINGICKHMGLNVFSVRCNRLPVATVSGRHVQRALLPWWYVYVNCGRCGHGLYGPSSKSFDVYTKKHGPMIVRVIKKNDLQEQIKENRTFFTQRLDRLDNRLWIIMAGTITTLVTVIASIVGAM